MLYFRQTPSARYQITETIKYADGSTNVFEMYTTTWREAREVLQRNWERWLRTNHDNAYLTSVANHNIATMRQSFIGINIKHNVAVAGFVGSDAYLTIQRLGR